MYNNPLIVLVFVDTYNFISGEDDEGRYGIRGKLAVL